MSWARVVLRCLSGNLPHSKHNNVMKNVGGSKTGQLEDRAAADRSGGDAYVSECRHCSCSRLV